MKSIAWKQYKNVCKAAWLNKIELHNDWLYYILRFLWWKNLSKNTWSGVPIAKKKKHDLTLKNPASVIAADDWGLKIEDETFACSNIGLQQLEKWNFDKNCHHAQWKQWRSTTRLKIDDRPAGKMLACCLLLFAARARFAIRCCSATPLLKHWTSPPMTEVRKNKMSSVFCINLWTFRLFEKFNDWILFNLIQIF